MASTPSWTYMLRLPERNPEQIRLDRLADYMRELALLLGLENDPKFAGIKRASTGLRAKVPARKRDRAWKRIQTAKYRPDSRPAKHLQKIEEMMGEDSIRSGQLLDHEGKLLYLFKSDEPNTVERQAIKQFGEVDGVVTGVVGADDTMHLHLRDCLSRDLRIVIRSESLARELLTHFRQGQVRVRVHGTWIRTDSGWIPEVNRCYVDGFEVLDETPAVDLLEQIASVADNGWRSLDDPLAVWRGLRGIH